MTLFIYSAANNEGKVVKGEREAENEKALAAALKAEKLFLIEAKDKKMGAGGRGLHMDIGALFSRLMPISLVEKMFFSRNLAVMVSAGLSLTKALDALTEAPPATPPVTAPAAGAVRLRDWPESQKLAFEKALLGFYVSGHPLARYERSLKLFATATSQQLLQLEEGGIATVGGMLTKIKHTTTKKTNEQMAVCMLEDLQGEVEVLVFPNSFSQLAPQLKPNAIVFVEGRVAVREDRPRLIAQQITPIEQGAGRFTQAMELILRRYEEKEMLEQLKGLLARFPGAVPITLRLEMPERSTVRLKLAEHFKVEPRQELLEELGQLLGEEAVVITRQAPSAGARAGRGGLTT